MALLPEKGDFHADLNLLLSQFETPSPGKSHQVVKLSFENFFEVVIVLWRKSQIDNIAVTTSY